MIQKQTLPRVCIDEDCPSCGYPERWADIHPESSDTPSGAGYTVFGCNECYSKEVRYEVPEMKESNRERY